MQFWPYCQPSLYQFCVKSTFAFLVSVILMALFTLVTQHSCLLIAAAESSLQLPQHLLNQLHHISSHRFWHQPAGSLSAKAGVSGPRSPSPSSHAPSSVELQALLTLKSELNLHEVAPSF